MRGRSQPNSMRIIGAEESGVRWELFWSIVALTFNQWLVSLHRSHHSEEQPTHVLV
jgi:hypothetical protein